VGPYQDRRLGLHKAAKFYHTTGWHETSTVTELIVNKAAWETLPPDLKEIVRVAAAACNVISQTWCEQTNAEALDDLVKNQGVTALPLPPAVVDRLKEVTVQVLNEAASRIPWSRRCTTASWASRRLRINGPACPRPFTTRKSAVRSSSPRNLPIEV